jgi:hypothetical protein
MKPLLAKDLTNFTKRFSNFINCEIRTIEIITSTTIILSLATQDESREFDWISLNLEFYSVSDAKLIDESKFHLLDTSEGISLIYDKDSFAFAIGNYKNISGIKNAVIYVIASNIKYEENKF